jgi:hypothetical protein
MHLSASCIKAVKPLINTSMNNLADGGYHIPLLEKIQDNKKNPLSVMMMCGVKIKQESYKMQ